MHPRSVPLALAWTIALAFAAPAMAQQLELPPEIGLQWQQELDGLSFGFEFPLASVALPGPNGDWCVSAGRIASPYAIERRGAQGGAVLWRFEAPHPIGQQLVAAPDGSAVYALAYDASEPAFRRASVLALRSSDGALLWENFLTSWSGTALVQEPSGLAISPDGARVFALGSETELQSPPVGFGTVGAFRASDGFLEWFQRRGPGDQPSFAFEALAFEPDPALPGGGRVLVAGGNGISQGGSLWAEAFSAAQGLPLWQRSAVGGRVRCAAAAGGRVAIGLERGSGGASLWCLASADGLPLWFSNADEEVVDLAFASLPGGGERLVSAGLLDGPTLATKNLLTLRAFEPSSGAPLWVQPWNTPWGSPGSIDVDGLDPLRLLAADGSAGRVWVGAGRGPFEGPEDFVVSAFELASGAPLWSRSVDVTPAQIGQGLRSLTLSADGQRLLALGDDAGPVDLQGLRLESFGAADGAPQWIATWNQGSSSANPPMDLLEHAASDSVFVLSRLNFGIYLVACLDASSGLERWNASVTFPGNVNPDLLPRLALGDGGAVLVLSLPGDDLTEVVAFDAGSGTQLWQRFTGSAGPVGQPGRILAAAPQASELYIALDSSAGQAGLRIESWSLIDGSTLWERDLGVPGFQDQVAALALDPSGKRLAVAATRRRVSGGPQNSDLLLVGVDTDAGQVLLAASFGDPQQTEEARALAITPDGRRASILGQRGGPSGPLLVAEYDLAAGFNWSRTIDAPGGLRAEQALYSLQATTLVIAAEQGGGFAPQTVLQGLLGANGAPLWQRSLPGPGGAEVADLALGADGLTVFSVGTSGLGLPNGARAFVAVHDALDGAPLWQAAVDTPPPAAGFFLDDVGRGLALSDDGRSLFAAAGVWSGATFTDTLLLRLRLAELLISPPAISLSSGGAQALRLRGGPALAGDAYLLLGSASGTAVSLSFDGFPLPLQIDGYTQFLAGGFAGSLLQGGTGLLDPLGRAGASLTIPPGLAQGLAGLTLHHAWLSVDLSGGFAVSWISNPAPLTLWP
jgi:outer membrane protein assembly factor BamB